MFNRATQRSCAQSILRFPQSRRIILARTFFNSSGPAPSRRYSRQSSLLLHSHTQVRFLTFSQHIKLGLREASKGIWRKNPILFPFAVISVIGATVVFAYVVYVQVTRVNPQYHKFPPEVAKPLRTAVYYTELDLNPSKALNAYKEALQIAIDKGLHPYSDEVFGIKLQVAVMLEKAGLVKAAIEVLERTKHEALMWIEDGRDRKAFPERKLLSELEASIGMDLESNAMKENELREYEERQRAKTLKKVIGMGIKLAELYSSDYIQDEKKAEEAQIAAVELCLKEMRRRQNLGLPVGGGSSDDSVWLNLTEIASAFAQLADTYTQQEKPELALSLYMQALAMIKEDEGDATTCKQVVLLNNVAQAMVEQARKPLSLPRTGSSLSRDQIIDNAKLWAEKALDVAINVQPSLRDESCDASCIVASVNLGTIAELQNKSDEAKRHYLKAKNLASEINYKVGLEQADIALGRLATVKETGK